MRHVHSPAREFCIRVASFPLVFDTGAGHGLPHRSVSRRMVTYDITIRPNRTGKTAVNRGTVEFALGRFPALRRECPGRYVHLGPNGRHLMSLQAEQSDPVQSIRVKIPGVLLRAEGGNVLRLCFEIAEQLGWGILDEQLGGYIERDSIPDILKRYEFTGETVTEFLDRRTAGRAGFADMFRYHIRPQTRKGMFLSIGIAAVTAGILVVYLGASASVFPWVGGALFLTIVSAKAVVQSIREMKRRGNPIRKHTGS